MKKNLPKTLLVCFLLAFVCSPFLALAKEKPKVNEIKNRQSTSLSLVFEYNKYKGKKVDVMVKIRNKKTDKYETQSFGKIKMGSDGTKKITLDQLTADTKYSFKVKIRKTGGGDYTPYSDPESTKTKK